MNLPTFLCLLWGIVLLTIVSLAGGLDDERLGGLE